VFFFSDQDELRKSLEFSPEERRVFIERLLGVEEWKDRVDSLRETRRRLEGFLASGGRPKRSARNRNRSRGRSPRSPSCWNSKA